jgi:uncharacterized DUF497 family protein
VALSNYDPGHSDDEDRYLTFGCSTDGRLLVVSHTDRGVRNRIISARVATRREKALLATDVRAAFPTDESVNEAIRSMMHDTVAAP